MNSVRLTPRIFFRMLKDSASEWSNDNAMRLAAALSYYSIFSIAPLLLIAIGIVGLVFGHDAAMGRISQELGRFIGWEAAKSIETMVNDAGKTGGGATVVGFGVLLFGASSVFGQLKEALNTIWGVKLRPNLGVGGFIKERLLSFGMVLVIGFLLLVSLLLSTTLAAFNSWIEPILHLPKFIGAALGFAVSFSVETLLFAMLFKTLPDARVKWRNVVSGAVATALLFEVGKTGLAWYLGQASTTSSFGAAGSLVVLLLWVFYASCILFFGAEFTKVYTIEAGDRIRPTEIAMRVHTDGSVIQSSPAVERQPHPLNPNSPVAPVPMRESLAPLLLSPDVESHELRELRLLGPRPRRPAPPLTQFERWVREANRHPVAEIGAAVGVGFAVGLVSRLFEKKAPVLSAPEHFQEGARKSGFAARSMAFAAAGWAAKHLTKKALRRYASEAGETSKEWTHHVAERLEKALR